MQGGLASDTKRMHPCRWLREEKELRRQAAKDQQLSNGAGKKPEMAAWSNGWTSGRMTSSLKNSSNAVMRM